MASWRFRQTGHSKSRVLDDGDGSFGITEDGRALKVELGDIFGERIGGEVGEFAAEQIAAVGR